MDGLTRAKWDLEQGNVRKARDRLKGLVATYPHDRKVRALLAEAYRRDRQWPEAGRWGYLIGPAATDEERTAFERHYAFGWYTRITEARLRRLLCVDDWQKWQTRRDWRCWPTYLTDTIRNGLTGP